MIGGHRSKSGGSSTSEGETEQPRFNLSDEKGAEVIEFFTGVKSSKPLSEQQRELANTLMTEATKATNAMSWVDRLMSSIGGASSLPAMSRADILTNWTIDAIQGGGENWGVFWSESGPNNPVVYNSIRNQMNRLYKSPAQIMESTK